MTINGPMTLRERTTTHATLRPRTFPAHALKLVLLFAVVLLPACDAATTTEAELQPGGNGSPTATEDGTPTPSRPTFPPARTDLEHRGTAWAVVLAGSEDPLDPQLEAAEQMIEEAGYFAGVTDCDEGAASALGLPEESFILTASAYFNSEEDANEALRAFRAEGFSGGAVAEVTTGCLD